MSVLAGPMGGEDYEAPQGNASFKVARGAFIKSLRTTGLVESIRFHNIAAPRLVGATGPGSNTLIVTNLTPSGTLVNPATCWWNSTGRTS